MTSASQRGGISVHHFGLVLVHQNSGNGVNMLRIPQRQNLHIGMSKNRRACTAGIEPGSPRRIPVALDWSGADKEYPILVSYLRRLSEPALTSLHAEACKPVNVDSDVGTSWTNTALLILRSSKTLHPIPEFKHRTRVSTMSGIESGYYTLTNVYYKHMLRVDSTDIGIPVHGAPNDDTLYFRVRCLFVDLPRRITPCSLMNRTVAHPETRPPDLQREESWRWNLCDTAI